MQRDYAVTPIATGISTATIDDPDPITFQEAIHHPRYGKFWIASAISELNSQVENGTWEIIPRENVPLKIRPTTCKWVWKRKRMPEGRIRFKGQLVIRGSEQTHGIDDEETFAPVSPLQLSGFRVLLAAAVRLGWIVHQMDVDTAFLNPPVDQDAYMELPEGLQLLIPGIDPTQYVCHLKKALYGLKHTPRLWHQPTRSFLLSLGFKYCHYDSNLYINISSGIHLLLNVDDLLIFAPNGCSEGVSNLKQQLMSMYKMTDLGLARQFLGLQIDWCNDGTGNGNQRRRVYLHQTATVQKLLVEEHMSGYSGLSTPIQAGTSLKKWDDHESERYLDDSEKKAYQSIVGKLMYIMLGTRPDLAYAMAVLSKFCSSPTITHMQAAKRVIRYLKETQDFGLCYEGNHDFTYLNSTLLPKPTLGSLLPVGYSSSDYAGASGGRDSSDRKSTSGYVFLIGGTIVSWKAKKQDVVAQSTIAAEYLGAADAVLEARWFRNLLGSLGFGIDMALELRMDSQGAICLSKDAKFSDKSKHVEIRYHIVKEAQQNGYTYTTFVPTHDMTADIMTKPLPQDAHWRHVTSLGLRIVPSQPLLFSHECL